MRTCGQAEAPAVQVCCRSHSQRAFPFSCFNLGVGDTEFDFGSFDMAQGDQYSRLSLQKSRARNVSSFQSLLKGHFLHET